MKIIYKRTKDKKLCTNENKAIKQLGQEFARDLFDLIGAIEEAAIVLKDIDLPQYRLNPLTGNKEGIYSLTINYRSKYRIEFIPLDENDEEMIRTTDLNTFYKKVKSIRIIEISEHYEK